MSFSVIVHIGQLKEEATEARVRSLIQNHGAAMLAHALRLTGDRHAAEDVVQEALVRAWRHSDRLDNSKGSVRAWLITVVRHLVYDRSRALRSRPTEVGDLKPDSAVSDDHADRVLDTIVVLDAVNKLPAHYRAVLDLVYLRGNTVAQAAAALDIPQGTVKSRTFHAIRMLRDVIPGRAELDLAGART
jgi:RNA polymerase sigma-70 factor (ECF subfamily)